MGNVIVMKVGMESGLNTNWNWPLLTQTLIRHTLTRRKPGTPKVWQHQRWYIN